MQSFRTILLERNINQSESKTHIFVTAPVSAFTSAFHLLEMRHVPSQLVCLRHLFQMVPVSSVCEDTDTISILDHPIPHP